MYIVINIIDNFLIKTFFTHGHTEQNKTDIALPTYQLCNVMYLIKVT